MTGAVHSDFARPGPTTVLDEHAALLGELPSGAPELARIVRGLVLHQGLVEPAGLTLPPERFADRERVGAAAIVQRVLELDAAPLTEARPPENRMVGYCYHFAVLHCALLRAQGVPSRARCGFAAYYKEGAWIDHWIVEYRDEAGWARIDPDSARDTIGPDDFRDAALAWQLCRSRRDDPMRYGNYEAWGWDELRGSLIADAGALNKVEVGDWETWCDWIAIDRKDEPHAEIDSTLDRVAALISNGAIEELQRVFRDDRRLQPFS